MPCLFAIIALLAPRFVIFLLVIFSDWLGAAYHTVIWPLLGFVFLPLTTLAYAWAWHASATHSINGLYFVVVVMAFLIDIGLVGGSGTGWGMRKSRRINVRVRRVD